MAEGGGVGGEAAELAEQRNGLDSDRAVGVLDASAGNLPREPESASITPFSP